MSKHDKRAARFGREVRREAVYARLAKMDRRYDRWTRDDRRRKGRVIVRARRRYRPRRALTPYPSEAR